MRNFRKLARPQLLMNGVDIFSPSYGIPTGNTFFDNVAAGRQPVASPMPNGAEPPQPAPRYSNAVPGYAPPTTGGPMPEPGQPPAQTGPTQIDKYAQIANLEPAPAAQQGQPASEQEQDILAALEGLDYNQASKAYASVDFTQGIDPEVAAKAMSGDAVSFQKVLNQVAAAAAAAATSGGARTTASALRAELGKVSKSIPEQLRQHQLQNLMSSDGVDSFLKAPEVAPAVEGMKNHFIQKYPHASPQQVQKMLSAWAADAFPHLTKKQEQEQQAPKKSAMQEFFNF